MKKREKLQKVYSSKKWQSIRSQVIQRDRGLCQICLKNKKLKPGYIVHHIIALTIQNMNNEAIAYGIDNMVCVCNDCHERIHNRKVEATVEGVAFNKNGEVIIN